MKVTFKCFGCVPPSFDTYLSSDQFDPRFKVPTVKHPDSVMVWGAFSGEMGRPRQWRI